MDDVLSAVDAPTAKHIFDQAVCGPLMKGRTKILVTHAVQLCAPKADLVVKMTRGKPKIIDVQQAGLIPEEIAKESTKTDDIGHNKVESAHVQNNAAHRLIEAESRMEGAVKLDVYLCYLKACGGPLFVAFLIFTFGVAQCLIVGNDFWVKIWTDQYVKAMYFQSLLVSFISDSSFKEGSPKVDLLYYIGIYAIIGGSSIILVLFRVLLVASASLKASRILHASLTFKILRAPVTFFEKTPMGRILNRFSKDMKDIDLEVAQFSSDFLANLVRTLSFLLVITVVTPISVVGLVPIFMIFVAIDTKYLRAQRALKRMESNTRSPIFSHFGEALSGVSTIRAFAAEDSFIDALHAKVDLNNQAFSITWILNRWLGVRMDMIGAFIGLTTMLSVLTINHLGGGLDAGYAALSITYSLGCSECLIWLVRMHALMEMEMNAVERVDEYLQLDEEPAAIIESYRPTADWPNAGVIKVDKLNLRYNSDGPKILSDITFSTKPGEKIGIVGVMFG
jgi:ABC-type multidrug transport system fused ATPase/permease subunit